MAHHIKKDYVSNLAEKLSDNPQYILIGFGSTPHKKLEEMRRSIREADAQTTHKPQLTILKNALFKIALERLQKKNLLGIANEAKGQSAILFLPDDWLSGIKAFYAYLKDDENLEFKVGYIDGVLYDKDGLKKLAVLPSREELAVKVILSLRSPQVRLINALQYNTMKLVYVLKSAGESKQ